MERRDNEVHIYLNGRSRRAGLARRNTARGAETILFEYDTTWLSDPERFSIDRCCCPGASTATVQRASRGAGAAEIERMASAFEHDDLASALAL